MKSCRSWSGKNGKRKKEPPRQKTGENGEKNTRTDVVLTTIITRFPWSRLYQPSYFLDGTRTVPVSIQDCNISTSFSGTSSSSIITQHTCNLLVAEARVDIMSQVSVTCGCGDDGEDIIRCLSFLVVFFFFIFFFPVFPRFPGPTAFPAYPISSTRPTPGLFRCYAKKTPPVKTRNSTATQVLTDLLLLRRSLAFLTRLIRTLMALHVILLHARCPFIPEIQGCAAGLGAGFGRRDAAQ